VKIGRLSRSVLYALCAVIVGCSGADTDKPPLESRDQLQEKIDQVVANGAKAPVPAKSTTFSENEVNNALTANLMDKIPRGVTEPQVRLLGSSRIAARAIVDVDEFKHKRGQRRSTGPLNFFGGKVPVLVRGELITRDGQAKFKLQSAEVNGVQLPNSLVHDLLATYTRSRNNPDGFSLDKPFDLPVNIRQVIVNPGVAIVVQ